ncbi:hypothetical protein CALCODRAFT_13571 [Calocera cornea HHB12733]|uniref:Helicase C-terminal domain-containing protein n=1 Tax=Calocera cornea HHB12733 TaxID=1353952 RepID=A0A165E9Y4_9BASI|nr:hypothetical protein CALCODRAFT_13571 [Calocera cornea HHB12733]
MEPANDNYQPPAETFAAGVLILTPQALPSAVSFDRWACLPDTLQGLIFANLEEQNVSDLLSDLCLAGFAQASIRGRHVDGPTGTVTRLYIRLYLLPISTEKSKNLLKRYHMFDMRERPRKLKPTAALATVLSYTSRDVLAWQCLGPGSHTDGSMFFQQYHDNRSLSEIFQDLPSPVLPPQPIKVPDTEPDRVLCDALTWKAPPGMRSTLFPYQGRTVWRMLAQELQPGTWADPRYVQMESMDDERQWYLNPYTCELRSRNDVLYDRVKGGILCEEMGSGKTCMCIALCLATKGRVVAPPNTPQASMALTKDSMTWEGVSENLPYHNLRRHDYLWEEEAAPKSVFPSLRQLAQYVAATSFIGLRPTMAQMRGQEGSKTFNHFRQVMQRFEADAELAEQGDPGSTLPFYLETEAEGARRATRDASSKLRPATRIWLSSLTLVLVPSMIFQQWNSEFLKHCDDDALRILSVPTRPLEDLPNANILIRRYDVVLMTHERFAAESMPASGRRSPLLDIRFQRLIIDEGHVANADGGRLKDLGLRLSVESRWIVTGTPTKNIKGLSMGSSKRKAQAPAGANVVHSRFEALLSEDSSVSQATNSWSRSRDGEDLRKLGNMFEFLKVPPFIGQDADWNNAVVRPLLQPGHPEFGAVQRLLRCLEGVMIRHRAEDIEQDVPLPELKQELVVLDMTEHSALTHNAVLAQIAINAIDSERKDQDYLFHPKNRASLGVVISNLSQSLFWHADNETDYAERVRTAIKSLATAQKRGVSAEDVQLIEQSIEHLSRARDHREWSTVMDRMWLPYEVERLPPVMQSWIRSSALLRDNGTCLMEAERISHIRGFAGLHQKDMQDNNLEALSELGTVFNLFDEEISQYVENLKQFREARQKTKPKPQSASALVGADVEEAAPVMAVQTASMSPAGSSRASKSKGKAKKEPPPPILVDPRYEAFRKSYPRDVHNAGFPSEASLTQTSIRRSLSNKVNYILSDILQYSATEKIVIFSSSSLSLSHLTEAFELYRIRFLHFHNALSVKDRENTIKTFETSEVYRVLLMELKHGARGLNLVSASRVYFCEPVWRADEESQAIKRCHRIGQIRDVTVKTLVIRGTAEEEAVRIRNAHPNDQPRQMVDDVSIKHFVEHPQFLEGVSQEWPLLRTTLLRTRHSSEAPSEPRSSMAPFSPVSPKQSKKRVRMNDESSGAIGDAVDGQASPQKKRKKGQFVDTVSDPSATQNERTSMPVPGSGVAFADSAPSTPIRPKLSKSSRKATALSATDVVVQTTINEDDDAGSVPQAALRSPLRMRIKFANPARQTSTSAAIAAASIPLSPPAEIATSPRSPESTPPPVTPSADHVFGMVGSSLPTPVSLRSSLKRARFEEDSDDSSEGNGRKRARFDAPIIVTLDDEVDEVDELMEDGS